MSFVTVLMCNGCSDVYRSWKPASPRETLDDLLVSAKIAGWERDQARVLEPRDLGPKCVLGMTPPEFNYEGSVLSNRPAIAGLDKAVV